MQLRSGATTGGTTPRGGIPGQIQIRQQPSQEEGDGLPADGGPGPRTTELGLLTRDKRLETRDYIQQTTGYRLLTADNRLLSID